MLPARWVLLIGALVFILWVASPVRRAGGGQVPCADIMRLVNHQVSALHGGNADLTMIAKTLGSTPAWVEHCMFTYGRRPKRPGRESAGSRQALFEKMEEEEPEEPEEKAAEEAGEVEKKVPEERPRVPHLRAEPTPTALGGKED